MSRTSASSAAKSGSQTLLQQASKAAASRPESKQSSVKTPVPVEVNGVDHELRSEMATLDYLDAEEQRHLEEVLSRIDQCRDKEEERLKRLANEKQNLEISRPSGKDFPRGCCICCGKSLNFFFNPSKTCDQCQKDACKTCCIVLNHGQGCLCRLCYSENIHEGKTGRWFKVNNSKCAGISRAVSAVDLLRASLHRVKEAIALKQRLQLEEQERERERERERLKREAEEHQSRSDSLCLSGTEEPSGDNETEPREPSPVVTKDQPIHRVATMGSLIQFEMEDEDEPTSDDILSTCSYHIDLATTETSHMSKKARRRNARKRFSSMCGKSLKAIKDKFKKQPGSGGGSQRQSIEDVSTPTSPNTDRRAPQSELSIGSVPEIVLTTPAGSTHAGNSIKSVNGPLEEVPENEVGSPQSAASAANSRTHSVVDGNLTLDRLHYQKSDLQESRSVAGLSVKSRRGKRSFCLSNFKSSESLNRLSVSGGWCQRKSMSQESVMSRYSENEESYAHGLVIHGDLMVALEYDFKHNNFFIHVKQCRNITAVDVKHKKSDPYVKTYLLPDKTKNSKRKTSSKKGTLNPIFNETLRYSISKAQLETRTLLLAVWHTQTFGHNYFLGEVQIPMDSYQFKEVVAQWYQLHEKEVFIHSEYNSSVEDGESDEEKAVMIPIHMMLYKGDLILAIKFVPGGISVEGNERGGGAGAHEKEGELHVWIREARNLVASRASGYADPFVKGYLLPDKSKMSKRKTQVARKTINPQWNTVLRFPGILESQLSQHSLELTVWDYERLSTNEFMGGLRINLGGGISNQANVFWMDAQGHEVIMWKRMIEKPNTWVEGSLRLRSNMD